MMQLVAPIQEHRYKHSEQTAKDLAGCIAQQIRTQLTRQDRVVLALSGGKSPIALFESLRTHSLPWDRVVITLIDERVVPESHPDSNSQLLRKYLLQEGVAQAQFLSWFEHVESLQALTPEALANLVNSELGKHLNHIDIAVLGMGEDGHTASWFPQGLGLHSAMQSTDWVTWVRPVTASHLRITLTKWAVLNAKYVHLSIAGGAKVQVYERAKANAESNLPIAAVLHSHHACQVWIAENTL
jgi:6-phosphogluconolactonase